MFNALQNCRDLLVLTLLRKASKALSYALANQAYLTIIVGESAVNNVVNGSVAHQKGIDDSFRNASIPQNGKVVRLNTYNQKSV